MYFLVDAATTEQHLGGVMNDFDLTIYTNERQIEPSQTRIHTLGIISPRGGIKM